MRFARTQSHEYEIQDIENIFGGSLYVTNRWYPALLWDHENSKKEIVKITSSRLSRSVSSRWNHLQKVREKQGKLNIRTWQKMKSVSPNGIFLHIALCSMMLMIVQLKVDNWPFEFTSRIWHQIDY